MRSVALQMSGRARAMMLPLRRRLPMRRSGQIPRPQTPRRPTRSRPPTAARPSTIESWFMRTSGTTSRPWRREAQQRRLRSRRSRRMASLLQRSSRALSPVWPSRRASTDSVTIPTLESRRRPMPPHPATARRQRSSCLGQLGLRGLRAWMTCRSRLLRWRGAWRSCSDSGSRARQSQKPRRQRGRRVAPLGIPSTLRRCSRWKRM
mmetsp:Transcript_132785/g.283690  ORF Transcript_132785/g.283690 Transcript_132785/m.283690 type:complete len:206 (-) Transcript_132785:213-830(-)